MSEPGMGFVDVQVTATGLGLPLLKWRELLFIGALRQEGDVYVRDPTRPMPPFAAGELFPEGVAFRAEIGGERVWLARATSPSSGALGQEEP